MIVYHTIAKINPLLARKFRMAGGENPRVAERLAPANTRTRFG